MRSRVVRLRHGADVQKRWGRLSYAPLVPMMKATDFRNRHDRLCGYFRDLSMANSPLCWKNLSTNSHCDDSARARIRTAKSHSGSAHGGISIGLAQEHQSHTRHAAIGV